MPSFDIGWVLAFLCSGMCFFTWAAVWSQLPLFVALATALGCFAAGCHVKSPPPPQQYPPETEVCSTMGESIRPSLFYNPTLSANNHVVQFAKAIGCRWWPSRRFTWASNPAVQRRRTNALKYGSVVPSSRSFYPSPLQRFQQCCLCTSHRDACERIPAFQAVLKGRTVAIWKGKGHQLGMFFLPGNMPM